LEILIKELYLYGILEKCNILKQEKNYDKALNCYKNVYSFGKKYSHKKILGDSLNGKAIIYFEEGKHNLAKQNFLQAETFYMSIWDYIGESAISTNIGNIYLRNQDILGAMRLFKTALSLDLILSNKALLSVDYFNLAKIYERMNKNKLAISYYKKAIMLDKEIGNQKALVIDLYSYGKFLKNIGQKEKAFIMLSESLEIAHNIGATQEAMYIKRVMDNIKKE
jgi:tetratricopeptide (TPR) repeat protein